MLNSLLYKIKRPYHFFKTGMLQGLISQYKYKNPQKSLKIITITGTDGKTTSANLMYHILKQANKKTALISTVAAYMDENKVDTGLHVTSPNPTFLYKFMHKMVQRNYEYLVLETTSHGEYQYRNWAIKPLISGITNITHEHLDYHLNFNNYIDAKALVLQKAKHVILNEDDQYFYKLKRKINRQKQKMHTYSHETKLSPPIAQAIKKRFKQKYNQQNARLCVKISQILNINDEDIKQAILKFPGVEGRFQEVPNNKNIDVIVDFAHTPNAHESVLKALRNRLTHSKSKGKLISIAGSAGLRDYQKRPTTGRIDATLADLAIFTADDPRTEDVWTIVQQMKNGITENHNKIISIADRKKAIEFALTKLAKPGDLVALIGKGHEKSLAYADQEIPWSDYEVAKEILTKK